MRIVAQLNDIDELEHLVSLGADVLLVHTNSFTRNTKYGKTIDEIKVLSSKIQAVGKEMYLLFNTMIHESQIDTYREFLSSIQSTKIDGFVCFDFSMYPLLSEFSLENKMIYQPGTLTTNYYDPIFVKENKIKGLTLSKEITLHHMMQIMLVTEDVEFSYIGHGYQEMFYSKRPLLQNYFIHKNHPRNDLLGSQDFYLIEELRKEDHYPIVEDMFGTTIFRSHPLHSFTEIGVIRPYLTDFFVERIFMEDAEYYDSLLAYSDPSTQKAFLEKYPHHFDSGFYYRDIAFTKEGGSE